LLGRLLLLPLCAFALWWAARALTIDREVAPLTRLADRVLNGEAFSLEALTSVLPQVEQIRQLPRCAAGNRWPAVVIQTRILEGATAAGDGALAARMLARLGDDTRDLLACSPHDAYAWFARFQVRTYENGFRDADLPLLEKSIELGPREGWLILKRLQIMVDVADALPPGLRDRIPHDFAALAANPNYAEHVVEILGELPFERRQLLLDALVDIPEERRANLKWRLGRRLIQGEVPGLATVEPRPWR
jgi:hypothetical protein